MSQSEIAENEIGSAGILPAQTKFASGTQESRCQPAFRLFGVCLFAAPVICLCHCIWWHDGQKEELRRRSRIGSGG